MDKINKDNPHIVREEDLDQTEPGAPDVYNAGIAEKNKFFDKDFLKFFKLPLVVIVFLIAIILVLKFLFFHKSPKDISKDKKSVLNPYKDKTLKYQKRFSSSVFNYADKKDNKTDMPEKSAKFNAKFNKEMKKLNQNIKLSKNSKNNGIYGQNNAEQNTLSAMPQINKKMVVFIEASYGKGILDRERGIRGGGRPVKTEDYNPAPPKQNNNNRDKGIVIPQGTVVSAYTKYKIFSYNTGVPIIAILSNSYYYRGKAGLKKGDKFFGTVSVKHSLNRLNISFDKIIKRSGEEVSIDAIAMMPDGSSAGLAASASAGAGASSEAASGGAESSGGAAASGGGASGGRASGGGASGGGASGGVSSAARAIPLIGEPPGPKTTRAARNAMIITVHPILRFVIVSSLLV